MAFPPMAFLLRSRLLGFLLLLVALPVHPAAGADQPEPDALSVEARLQRIAASVREREGEPLDGPGLDAAAPAPGADLLAGVFVNGPRVGWSNGGWRNGGFYNGGFRNGGFWNGGFRNGGGWSNGGFRNGGGFRNFW